MYAAWIAPQCTRLRFLPSPSGRLPAGEKKQKKLFHFDGRTGVSELLLDVLGFVLGHALFDRLGSAIDQILGFYQAQAGDFTDGLDDFVLLRANILQDDAKFGLGFSRG